ETGTRVAVAAPAAPAASASAMDGLLSSLPADGVAPAPAAAPPAAPPAPPAGEAAGWRFDMHQDGRTMTADEFDAWMQARRVRVATGRAGKPDPSAPAATTASAPMSAAPEATAAGVLLQVAAFGSRSNAERALAALQGAGIAGARLHDGAAAG